MFCARRRIQQDLPKTIQNTLRTLCASFLVLAGCLTAHAGSVWTGVTPLTAFQAAEKETKTVKNQCRHFYNLGRKEAKAGNYEKARTYFQQVLTLDPQHRGAKKEMQKLTEAGISLASDAAANPVLTYSDLTSAELLDTAKVMMKDGDYETAQTVLEQALEKSNDDKEQRQIRSYLSAMGKKRGTDRAGAGIGCEL